MEPFIPYGRQWIDEDDVAAVVAALRSPFLTCGPEVEAFEADFAEFLGVKHAVAVANGTAALHLAMLAAGTGPGDRVVTSPNTFLASANCAAFTGATPDFCDIDPVSCNLDPTALENAWREDIKAVVAVDYAGQAADYPAIAEVARSRGAIVIEDGCHGIGGGFRHDDREWKIGGHPWCDMAVFSFHPVKTMTTGEGGMLVTDNDDYAQRARLLRTHGMERDPGRFSGFGAAPDDPLSARGPWIYEMQELGYNYRVTDLQCALGRSQLRKLPEYMERRREVVARYNEALADLPWLTTPAMRNEGDRDHASWHLYTVQIDFVALGKSRREVMSELRDAGVGTQVLYIPVHLQPWYRQTYGYAAGKCPVAEEFYLRALSLPMYAQLGDGEVGRVIDAVRRLS